MSFLLNKQALRTWMHEPCASAILKEATHFNRKRVFVFCSSSLRDGTDEIGKIEHMLGDRCAGIMTNKIRSHTPRSDLLDSMTQAKMADADMIVGVGSGSVVESAKAAKLMFSHWDQFEQRGVDAFDDFVANEGFFAPPKYEITQQDLPVVCVPTTLSGAEQTFIIGISKEDEQGVLHKQPFSHPCYVPSSIVFDADLCRHTPRQLWDSTGVRSIDHAVEAIFSIVGNEYFEAQAVTALRLTRDGLVNRDATKALLGAMMSTALVADQIEFGASHGISHALGAFANLQHGFTSCVLLPSTMLFNQSVVPKEKYDLVAEAMRFESKEHVVRDMVRFIDSLNLPTSIVNDIGVDQKVLAEVAEHALHYPWTLTNPRQIESAQQILDEILNFDASPFLKAN